MEQTKTLDLAEATKPKMVDMVAPDDVSSISVRGMSFDIPENGTVSAPPDIAEELKAHGFKAVLDLQAEHDAERRKTAPPRSHTRAKLVD